MENIDSDPNNATEVLSAEQLKVLHLISFNGNGTTYIRDKAKRMGVARPLNTIKELTNLGHIEVGRDNNHRPILTRIR